MSRTLALEATAHLAEQIKSGSMTVPQKVTDTLWPWLLVRGGAVEAPGQGGESGDEKDETEAVAMTMLDMQQQGAGAAGLDADDMALLAKELRAVAGNLEAARAAEARAAAEVDLLAKRVEQRQAAIDKVTAAWKPARKMLSQPDPIEALRAKAESLAGLRDSFAEEGEAKADIRRVMEVGLRHIGRLQAALAELRQASDGLQAARAELGRAQQEAEKFSAQHRALEDFLSDMADV